MVVGYHHFRKPPVGAQLKQACCSITTFAQPHLQQTLRQLHGPYGAVESGDLRGFETFGFVKKLFAMKNDGNHI